MGASTATAWAAAVVALAGLGASAGAATAAPLPPRHGVFQVAPARQIVVGRPPATLTPAVVTNTTAETRRVTVKPVLLHQRVSGELLLDGDPLPMHEASLILRAQPSRFTLRPGQKRSVRLSWRMLPLNATSADVGVVYESVPADPRSAVRIGTRLLSLNMMRLPGTPAPDGWVTALNAVQPEKGVLRFLVRVRNDGRRAGWPRTVTLTIRDARGRVRLRTKVNPDVILRRAEREFPIDVRRPRLPAGRYTASTEVGFGGDGRSRATRAFTLVGTNELPSPRLRIGPLTATGMDGGPAEAAVTAANSGTAAASATLRFALYRVTAGTAVGDPVARHTVRTHTVAPGDRRRYQARFGEVEPGSYRVEVLWTDPTGAIQSVTADFAASAHLSALDRLRDWVALHRTALLIGLGAFLTALLVAALVRRQAGLQAQLRAMRPR